MFEPKGFLNTALREGETDGGGGPGPAGTSPPPVAASTSTEAATPPADAGQPNVAADASPTGPAAAGDGAPADAATGDGAPPAGDGEAPPQELPDLSDETIANLIEAYGPKWREHPKFKEWVQEAASQLTQQQLAEASRQPEADPLWRELSEQANESIGQVLNVVQKLDAGDVDVDATELSSHFVKALDFTEAGANRTNSQAQYNLLSDVVVQGNAGKMPVETDAVHADVKAALEARQQALVQVRRLKGQADAAARAGRDRDAKQLREQTAAADRSARDAFTKQTLQIAYDAGKRQGETVGLTKNEKQTAARIALKADNAFKEAAAKVAAGTLPSALTNGNGNGGNVSTYAELLKLPEADKSRWIDAHPAKFNEFLNINT